MKKKTRNGDTTIIKRTTKIADKVESTQETIEEVESIQKVISDTLYVKDNIAVDLRNFSLFSIPN